MSVIVDGSNGLIFNDASTQTTAATGFGFKNRIINGDMRIDQRNAGAATANTISGYTIDRWSVIQSVTGKLVAQQNAGSVTPPAGFKNYLGVTSQSAYSTTSTDYYAFTQKIEGFNVADLGWGTANAQTVTLSFWVRSSLTGTFGGAIRNDSYNYNYPFTYSISSANTWEQKSVTITGATSGTWLSTNGTGIDLWFGLGVGSTYSAAAGSWTTTSAISSATGATSVVGTNGATWYITGVQLEKGSTATSFDYRDYGNELRMCQRYYYQRTYYSSGNGHMGVAAAYTTSSVWGAWIQITNEFRATPTLTRYPSYGDFYLGNASGSGALSTSSGSYTPSANRNGIYWDVARTGGGLTAGNAVVMWAYNDCTFGLSAEL